MLQGEKKNIKAPKTNKIPSIRQEFTSL